MQTGRQGGGFRNGDAEPVHAGVNVHRCATAPAASSNESVPLGQFRKRIDDRLNIDFGEGRSGLRGESIEHVDGRVARAGARAPGLGNISDEEGPAASIGEFGGDRLETKPIGVGFDHRGAFGCQEKTRERAEILLDGI